MKVLLAPENPAGVASTLRDALRRRGHEAELVVFRPHPFGLPHDRLAGSYAARAREALRALRRHEVWHLQFGTSLGEFADVALGRLVRRPLVLMHYWGGDVRLAEVSRRLHPARARVHGAATGGDEATVRRRLRLAGRLCRAALVSDLELAAHAEPYFERIYVVPTPLDLAAMRPEGPRAADGPPVVLHAPSHAPTKGTPAIVAAIDRAADQVPLRRRLVSGVPRAEVLGEIARADVVVDQLNSETTGVFALEAMALGKPVLVEFRREMLAPFAQGSPAVAVTPETLEEELLALCGDASRRAALGAAGRAFVEQVHDSDRVAAAVEHVYAHAPHAPPGRYQATAGGIAPLASPGA